MPKFANLDDQTFNAYFHAGRPGSRDSWTSEAFKGRKVRLLPTADLVKRGILSTRQSFTLIDVTNAGFNGQVAFVKGSDGKGRNIPLKDFRPVI